MTSKFVHILTAAVFAVSITAVAQTGTAATPLPAAPSAASSPDTPKPAVAGSGNKIGTISIEQAIYTCNEGQRDMQALEKTLQPKQNELKTMNDELEGLKKQLNAGGEKLTVEARNNLTSQIGQKQKVFDRSLQDARDDMQNQNQQIGQKILQKMAPILLKYATDKGYGLIIETSKVFPDGPVIPIPGSTFDITKAIVDLYNTQSGVAAPTPTASRPTATHPAAAGTTAKPATPSKPATPEPTK